MNALEWLKERQRKSLENQALFNAVPFEQTAHGFMARNYKQPEVTNKLVQKRGEDTLTKTWVSPYPQGESTLKVSAVPDYERAEMTPLPPPVYKRGFRTNQGALSPEAQAAIAQVQATGGQNVDAYGDPIGVETKPSMVPSRIVGEDPWGRSMTQEQASMITDEQPGYGDPRRSYVFGDTMAPGVGSQPMLSSGNTGPSTREGWGPNILNMGNILNRMRVTKQGIDDRQERNRIRKLMQYRTANPYYATGNPYGMNAVNRSPYSGGRY